MAFTGATAAARRNAISRAGSLAMHDSLSLTLTQHRGTQILQERGAASGTVPGAVSAEIRLYYTEAFVSFSARGKGGTLTGRGTVAYYVSGHTGHFKGTVVISGGTGRYAHARGSRISLVGMMARGSYATSLDVSGSLGS